MFLTVSLVTNKYPAIYSNIPVKHMQHMWRVYTCQSPQKWDRAEDNNSIMINSKWSYTHLPTVMRLDIIDAVLHNLYLVSAEFLPL